MKPVSDALRHCISVGGPSRKNAGTGITTKDGVHFTCWAGCFTNSDIIDIIGLQHGLNENDHVHKFEEALKTFGIEIEKSVDYQVTPKEKSIFFLKVKKIIRNFSNRLI